MNLKRYLLQWHWLFTSTAHMLPATILVKKLSIWKSVPPFILTVYMYTQQMISLFLLLMRSALKTTEMELSQKNQNKKTKQTHKKRMKEVRIYPVLHLVERHLPYVNHLIPFAKRATASVFVL